MKHLILVLCLLPFCLQAQTAATPIGVNFQGRLTDSNGVALPDGTGYEISFRIWSAATGGSTVWGATYSNIVVKAGSFNVILGATGGVPVTGVVETTDLSAAFNAPGRYLGLTVKRGATGTPVATPTEIVPRQQLLTVPFAFTSAKAALVNTDGVLTAAIKDGEVKTADIATDAITNAKIATGAVNADSIAANVITSSHIASGGINPDRLNQTYGFYFHEVAAGSDAPSPAPGWQVRTLSGGTNSADTSVVRSGNSVTLQPGTYYVEAEAFIYRANGHQLILRDITASPAGNPTSTEAVLRGAANWSPTLSSGNSPISSTMATVKGYVTVTATAKKFELWHFIDTNIASTFGVGASVASGLPYRPVTLQIIRIK